MSKSDYNFTSRLLHRLALQYKAIAEISFDIENALVKKSAAVLSDNPVFITGLARSGTTMLMRYLYETGLFRSLTYLDMPFVLMPNLWKKIAYKKQSAVYKERAHLDKIMVGFDSPEALEEVFWRTFSAEQYIHHDRLKLYQADNDVLKKFQDYVYNIITSRTAVQQTRYLSKNNNNILRLQQLQNSMPLAQFVVPFREPLQHALSLLNQHLHFSKIHKEDRFSLSYMNWLGHFEFGLNQKPFFLNNEKVFEEMQRYDKTDINYWLLSWKNYYQYISTNAVKNTIFFNYEEFCKNPSVVLPQLFAKLNIVAPGSQFEAFEPTIRAATGFDRNLLEECKVIYDQLLVKND